MLKLHSFSIIITNQMHLPQTQICNLKALNKQEYCPSSVPTSRPGKYNQYIPTTQIMPIIVWLFIFYSLPKLHAIHKRDRFVGFSSLHFYGACPFSWSSNLPSARRTQNKLCAVPIKTKQNGQEAMRSRHVALQSAWFHALWYLPRALFIYQSSCRNRNEIAINVILTSSIITTYFHSFLFFSGCLFGGRANKRICRDTPGGYGFGLPLYIYIYIILVYIYIYV